MTIKSTAIAPPYSIVVIDDAAVTSTDSCVVVGCISEADGETEITLDDMDQIDTGDHLLFTGEMKTPNRKIALLSCRNETLLEAATAHQVTSVRVWTNDLAEPDRVIVGFR